MDRLLVADRAGGRSDAGGHAHHGRARRRLLGSERRKTFTTNAHYADVCVAMAVTDRAASQHGISAFILEKGTPGFRAGKKENKLGMRASATGEVIFTDCRVPQSQLLGKHGEGFVDSLRDSRRRPHLDCGAVASASRRARTKRRSSIRSMRKQFGRPISEFQAIQHKLADMATEIDAARLLTYARRG